MNSEVLVCGNDSSLLHLREQVLASAHFYVRSAVGLEELERVIPALAPKLVIFCHSLSLEEQRRGSMCVREVWPETRILLMGTQKSGGSVPGSVLFDSFEGPAKLIETVQRCME